MHLGHVAHLIWVFGLARALGARVLLRIEDHDRSRSRPEYEKSILRDLAWLGFKADNFKAGNFKADSVLDPTYRQSDNNACYQAALAQLQRDFHVYPCVCSRKEIAKHSPLSEGGERCYSGRCRGLALPVDAPHGLRLELPPGHERFLDGLLGPQVQEPARQCGDILLRDRQGQWTYQFAVVVDDIRHGVDLVIRGEDLSQSTGRQIALGRMLGRLLDHNGPARFFHHPLIRDAAGEKLSKRTAATAVANRRLAGEPPEAVLGDAAHRVGLLSASRGATLDEILNIAADRATTATP